MGPGAFLENHSHTMITGDGLCTCHSDHESCKCNIRLYLTKCVFDWTSPNQTPNFYENSHTAPGVCDREQSEWQETAVNICLGPTQDLSRGQSKWGSLKFHLSIYIWVILLLWVLVREELSPTFLSALPSLSLSQTFIWCTSYFRVYMWRK